MFSFGDRRARKGIDIELFVFRILGVEIGIVGNGVSKSFLRDLSRLSWAVFLLFVLHGVVHMLVVCAFLRREHDC